MKTGTCVIFAITADEIYVAADTRRNLVVPLENGSLSASTDYICKILNAGGVYVASSGLNYHEFTEFDVPGACIQLVDPGKSIRENIEIIEADLYEKYLRTAEHVSTHSTDEEYATFQENPVHMALFGFESGLPQLSTIKFTALSPGTPSVDVCKRYDLRGDPTLPSAWKFWALTTY